jgi:hypothetical protein
VSEPCLVFQFQIVHDHANQTIELDRSDAEEREEVCEYAVYLIIVQFDSDRFANDSTYLRFRGISVSSEKKHGKDHVQNDVSGNHFV